jgi:SET domain-containing protein
MGGFARVAIPAGERIIEYVGERIPKAESNRRCEQENPFIFSLDEIHDLDGNVAANVARFLNHSCTPNCEAIDDGGKIWIETTRAIGAGEELTFNYGYLLDDYRDHPCQCGAPDCVGYMVAEEFYETVRRKNAMRADAMLPVIPQMVERSERATFQSGPGK